MPKLRLMMASAVLSAVVGGVGMSALAEDADISERDMLEQAVALYEKLSNKEADVPNGLPGAEEEPFLGKSVALGFINADEMDSISGATTIRKQDVMTILYKTIIDFDDSYALSSEEVDEIMNRCCDNALIDEENRVGYAFMIKHGIIEASEETDPNKVITWNSCSVLVDLLYDMFMQDVTFNSAGTDITIGANIESVTDILGEPDRIDESDYGFDWYVYNSDYSGFMMIGVTEGRICAFFSNNGDFETDGIKSGDDELLTFKYAEDDAYRFFSDSNGKIDAVMYNPHQKSKTDSEAAAASRGYELVDMINANRVKNGFEPLKIDEELWQNAGDMAVQPKYIETAIENDQPAETDGAVFENGYDVCSVYSKLLKNNDSCFTEDMNVIGVGTALTSDYSVSAGIIREEAGKREESKAVDIKGASSDELPSAVMPKASEDPEESSEIPVEEENTASSDEIEETAKPVEEEQVTETPVIAEQTFVNQTDQSDIAVAAAEAAQTSSPVLLTTETGSDEEISEPTETDEIVEGAPVVVSHSDGDVIEPGKPFEIELEKSVAKEYYVRIYSIEDDKYIVDSYVKTEGTKLTFTPELFENGKDYTVSISALTDNGTVDGKSFTVSCGSAYSDDTKIVSPAAESTIDNDYIDIEWQSSLYHDFVVDIYNEEGKLMLSESVSDTSEATVQNVEPGTYYIYVSAVRRGSSGEESVVKAQDGVKITVELPEPVITEYILEDGEKFYPVYEDEEMGVVCFYDEDFVDVTSTDSKGRTVTETKKKITEKQVKATTAYKRLAASQQKVEYFEGSDKRDLKEQTTVSKLYNNGTMSFVGDGSAGQAIVEEAEKYLGVPYVWGGTTPAGFDCSGLVQYVCKSLGIDVSRVSQDQYYDGIPVSREDLMPGDLVFFENNGDVHHVGIYVGDGIMIHAPYTGAVVQYQSIDTPYYSSQFCGGRRVAF